MSENTTKPLTAEDLKPAPAEPAKPEATETKPVVEGDGSEAGGTIVQDEAGKEKLSAEETARAQAAIAESGAQEKAKALPLRTDGPTLAEFVAAGYAEKDYPPAGYAAVVEKFEPESLHPSNATVPAPVQREEDKEGDLGSHQDYYHPEAHKPAGAWHDQNPK